MKGLWRAICLWWIGHEIKRIEARIYDNQKSVDTWPQVRGVWLQEIARLKCDRDRLTGRGDRVNLNFGGRART